MTDHPLFQRRDRMKAPSRSGSWRRLRRLMRRMPLIDRTMAAWYCAWDPRTPLSARAALFGAVAYFIMPFDLIPDFLPGIAHIDDAAVMLLAIRFASHRITPDHRERASARLDRWAGVQSPS